MPKIENAVDEYDSDPSNIIGYHKITGHLIFDIKMGENFRRKARFVADVHMTETLSYIIYSMVVFRDSVRICLTISSLNDLYVLAADVENSYLLAPCYKQVWMRARP